MTAPAEKRLMTRSDAADYCSLSMAQFSQWVAIGRLPQSITGTHRWDRRALDDALDKLSGLSTKSALSPLEKWKAEQSARSA